MPSSPLILCGPLLGFSCVPGRVRCQEMPGVWRRQIHTAVSDSLTACLTKTPRVFPTSSKTIIKGKKPHGCFWNSLPEPFKSWARGIEGDENTLQQKAWPPGWLLRLQNDLHEKVDHLTVRFWEIQIEAGSSPMGKKTKRHWTKPQATKETDAHKGETAGQPLHKQLHPLRENTRSHLPIHLGRQALLPDLEVTAGRPEPQQLNC